ncbi:conserved Plasmodium protein, unknown function [Plasmodium gallinaceum]|uniref:Uncharacterized protein n=1 Tax=Plasmodium gallinaceum TaxID=5849 RepID=A0A1J1H101_PLAGA|nr:conserved Plasmodium protein, unknown function [Plasmodium gallinaceum]CRG96949.1 conserved Plasmodium protein, unknown function [Plasmodium gallinaceum]
MSWKQFSRVLSKLLGKQGLKKSRLKFREIKKNFKIVFNLIFGNYFNQILNKPTKGLISNFFVKYIFNTFASLYNKNYKIGDFKLFICHFFLKNKLNGKLAKCKIGTHYTKKKKYKIIKDNISKCLESSYGLEPNEHYIIDMYDETHLHNEYHNTFLLNNKTFSFELDYNTTQMDDYGRINENDRLNSSSYLENDILSFDNIEYDEDEANESIKNCYLYNGYINADTYKNSEEYKFLKNHLKQKKDSIINIEIGIPSEYCDKQIKSESGSECESENKSDINSEENENEDKKMINKKRKKQKKKIYEIYNTETTIKQNIYCANYLNENYSSSYDYASEESSSSRSDFIDKDFYDEYFGDNYGNDFLCHCSVRSYDTFQST